MNFHFIFSVVTNHLVPSVKKKATMPPGPPIIGVNRFALLAENSKIKKKKKKTTINKHIELFPELPSVKKNNPKFVVLEAVDKNKTLSQYSCFAVHRSLNLISKEIHSISELRDGNLLLLVNSKSVAEKFLALKELYGICAVKAKYHENLNFNKGTVYAPFLNNVSESEIVNELSSQGVVAVYKFQKKVNEGMQPSGVVLLTFDLFHIPEKLDIAWRNVRVRQYVPSPMRCKNCQILGHTAKFCKRAPACDNCSLPPHSPEVCTRTFCANCASDHPSSSNKCEKFIQAKEIMKIKVTKKCTMREAVNIHKNSSPSFTESSPSFSSVAMRSEKNVPPTVQANSQINYKQQNANTIETFNSALSAQSDITTSINKNIPLYSQQNITNNTINNNPPLDISQNNESLSIHSQKQYPPHSIDRSENNSPQQLDLTSLTSVYNSLINNSALNLSNNDDNFEIDFNAYNRHLQSSTDTAMVSDEEA